MTPADLIAARTSLGLGQAALARALGMSVTAVWRWEKGERPVPPWLPLALKGLVYDAVAEDVRTAVRDSAGSPVAAVAALIANRVYGDAFGRDAGHA